MPFKQIGDKLVWEDPTEEDLSREATEIVQAAKGKGHQVVVAEQVPQNTQEMPSLKTYMAKTNKAISTSIKSMVSEGIRPVDIVVPIHGGLHIASKCIEAVLTRTNWPYRLIIVDDASDAFTQKWLSSKKYPDHVSIIYNYKNRGFAATVNRGIKSGDNPYICLLNSDVIVTDNWLTKMVMALDSNPNNVIVNPITNNTALINVETQQGADYISMNQAFEMSSRKEYPEIMPTGFCFMFRRNLTNIIGLFDEAFKNFGEEDLTLDSPVLTGSGWSTVGDIELGDKVFNIDGTLSTVLKTTKVMTGKKCYEVSFDTGEKIQCSADHKWEVMNPRAIRSQQYKQKNTRSVSLNNRIAASKLFEEGVHYKEIAKTFEVSIRTAQDWKAQWKAGTLQENRGLWITGRFSTEELVRKGVRNLNDKRQLCNFWIPLTRPLKFEKKNLILDPYILGAWLGDGTSAGAGMSTADKEIVTMFGKAGWKLCFRSKYDYTISPKQGERNDRNNPNSILFYLNKLGLLHNKHIPNEYKFSSYEQRLSIIQGLMDTDGHCTKDGKCSFDNSNLNLIHSCAFILRSMGIKCSVNKASPPKKNAHKQMYRVIFRVDKNIPVFKLTRKLKSLPEKISYQRSYHKITNIKEIDSVPTKCISIDHPSHLFLAGKHLIPTSNSDYWMKAITHLENGYYKHHRAVLADDTYLFHERGSSYSALGEATQMDFRKVAASRFHNLWPQYKMWLAANDPKKIMAPLRESFPKKSLYKANAKYRICWVVRSTSMCGGMKFISDIVNEINERGGDAKVALVQRASKDKTKVIPELRTRPIVFESDQDFIDNFSKKVFKQGVVVASISELAHVVKSLCTTNKDLKGLHHVQSYDPLIAGDKSQKKAAMSSYSALPYTITNSKWITDKLKESHKVNTLATIRPGVDRLLYYPRGRDHGDDRPTIGIILNKSYPFKGYARGVDLCRFLQAMANKNKTDLRILAFGADVVPEAPFVIGLGELSPARLAKILGTEIDIFIDPANYHSYGLPALEAMSSGVPIVSWDNIGVNEYAKHGYNCHLFPEDATTGELAKDIFRLLGNVVDREELVLNGLKTAEEHDRAEAVKQFISSLELNLGLSFPKRKIVLVSPHFRKNGGPTTIINMANELHKKGHDVTLHCIYTDINPEVTLQSKVPINLNIKAIPPCDVLIVNSDNPDSKFFSELPQAKHKILFKMSHNPRFKGLEEASLNETWDKVITTTQWLVDVVKTPLKDWSHPATKNVVKMGWNHYGHSTFNCPPANRKYGSKETSFIITTLIHQHPLKGSMEVIGVLDRLRRKYPLEIIGVGEIPPHQAKLPEWLEYVYAPSRSRMAEIMCQTDVWVGASKTEGLGRMALEAMSSGAACVLSNTDPEFAESGKNCLLYTIDDGAAMEKHIEYLLDNPDKFMEICREGYKTAKNSSPAKYIDKLEQVIFEVCEKDV